MFLTLTLFLSRFLSYNFVNNFLNFIYSVFVKIEKNLPKIETSYKEVFFFCNIMPIFCKNNTRNISSKLFRYFSNLLNLRKKKHHQNIIYKFVTPCEGAIKCNSEYVKVLKQFMELTQPY